MILILAQSNPFFWFRSFSLYVIDVVQFCADFLFSIVHIACLKTIVFATCTLILMMCSEICNVTFTVHVCYTDATQYNNAHPLFLSGVQF